MSSWSERGRRTRAGKGWGAGKSGSTKPAYGWQQRSPDAQRPGRAARRRRELQWALYSVLAACLLGVLVYILLNHPAKTPVLLATGVGYAAPVPPNQWAFEDRETLMGLDDKSLAITEISGSWVGAESKAWREFCEHLQRHKDMRRGLRKVREPLVVYFSMPGLVDEQGAPCLLPPGASPLRSDNWLRVDAIVRQIERDTPPERPKLLILDSNRQLVNWDLGIVYNTFAERLAQYVANCGVENLAVITAADAGQASCASPALGRSAFGHFLGLGLAGAADAEGLAGDGEVSLQELAGYLHSEVGAWASNNLAAEQRPALLTSREATGLDFPVTQSLGGRAFARYERTLAESDTRSPSVGLERIQELWQKLDALREQQAVRYDPLTLADFENRLLRLEQLAYGGGAFEREAEHEARSLASELGTPASADQSSRSLADRLRLTNPVEADALPREGFHSHPLRAYFGEATPSQSEAVRALWRRLAGPVITDNASPSELNPEMLERALLFPDTQLLVAAHQQDVWSLGASPADVAGLLEARAQAERLATPGDDQSLPGDERAHYYVRAVLDEADKRRRLAEDELFVESPAGVGQTQWLSEVKAFHNDAARVRADVTDALNTCDIVWSEAPYLAAWRCRAADAPTRKDVDALRQMILGAHKLGEAIGGLASLRQRAAHVTDIASGFETSADQLQREHQVQRSAFDTACEGRGVAEGPGELRDLEALLSTPLIAAEQRAQLLAARDALAERLNAAHFQGPGGPSPDFADKDDARQDTEATDDDASAGSDSLAELTARWNGSPLLALLDPQQADPAPPGGADPLTRLENECWRARNDLSKLKGLNVVIAGSWDSAAPDPHLDDRLVLSRAERRVRAAASLASSHPAEDPIAKLRRFDLQQLLLWHARRTLDDFWCTVTRTAAKTIDELRAPVDRVDRIDDAPYFQMAAEDYRRAAIELSGDREHPAPGDQQDEIFGLTPGVDEQIKELDQLVQQRVNASTRGLRVQGGSRPVVQSPDDLMVDLAVEPGGDGGALPSGTAAVYLSDGGVRLHGDTVSGDSARWGRVTVPVASGEAQRMTARVRGHTDSPLNAVAFFRGHQFRHVVPANALGGALVSFEPPEYDMQSVTLYGDQPRPPSVVFILDCSYTMIERTEAEVPGQPKQERMKVAVTALKTMLSELEGRQTSRPRVGVRFFGHRVGWAGPPLRVTRNPNATKLRRDGSFEPIPQDLPPALDVELALPLGNFGNGQLGEIAQRLDRLEPIGVTPVNLAILEALDDFRSEADDASKSIIVITDGKDDQFHSTSTGFKGITKTSTQNVVNAWKALGKDISVFIVGFGIPRGELGEAVREFQKIADATNGGVVTADSGSDLIDHLRKRLDINGYVVRGPGGPITRDFNGEEEKVELNSVISLPAREYGDQLPMRLQVSYQTGAHTITKPVTIEGGEALKLQLTRAGDDIVARQYEEQMVARDLLVRGPGGAPTDVLARAHRPLRRGDVVRFRVSIQDQASHFTPRPKETWVEVTPEGAKDSYVFYDTAFEPDTPVPVISFSAANWPEGVETASVRFWCSDNVTPPVRSFPLSGVVGRSRQGAAAHNVAGVSVRVGHETGSDGTQLVFVDEEHPRGSAARVNVLRVLLDVADESLRPESVSRRFDAANGVASHTFVFPPGTSARELAEHAVVRIATGEAVKASALQLADPDGLRVRIVDEDDTHVPTASANAR